MPREDRHRRLAQHRLHPQPGPPVAVRDDAGLGRVDAPYVVEDGGEGRRRVADELGQAPDVYQPPPARRLDAGDQPLLVPDLDH